MARKILLKPKLKVYMSIKSIQFVRHVLNAHYVPGIGQGTTGRQEDRSLRHATASPGTQDVVDPSHPVICHH